MFWGLLGAGLASGGTGVSLIAQPGTGFWGTAGWVLAVAGLICLMAAAVALAKRQRNGDDTQAVASGGTGAGSVSGNVIQHSTVNVSSGVSQEASSDEDKRPTVDVTPQYLTGLFHGRTSAQAQRQVEAYVGRWIRVAGPLGDVWPYTHGFAQVTFEFDTFPTYDDAGNRVRTTSVYMYCTDRKVADRLALLEPGTPITMFGRIEKVEAGAGLHLNRCELVKVGPARDQSGAP